MNPFERISEEAEKLTEKANKYLDGLEFLTNGAVCKRIYKAAKIIFERNNEDWDKVPEWVADTMDGWIPYSKIPHNGSINFVLSFSSAAQDAHLRNLLERVEGRETKELDFGVCVPKKVIDKIWADTIAEEEKLKKKLAKV